MNMREALDYFTAAVIVFNLGFAGWLLRDLYRLRKDNDK